MMIIDGETVDISEIIWGVRGPVGRSLKTLVYV